MRILVTGGAGFIGSHVCQRLAREGHAVHILDNLDTYYSPDEKRRNLAQILYDGPAILHEIDLRDDQEVGSVFHAIRPEAIVHLAAYAGVRRSLESPLLYESVNVRGTVVLLEASRRVGVRKIIFASSSSVYGENDGVPVREERVTRPISPYAATKVAGEQLCYTYHHLYRLSVLCLRLFSIYGPRQRPDLAIRKFTERIVAGTPIDLFGDGTTTRDYTYVDDVVEAIVEALQSSFEYDVFNIGNSRPVKLLDVVGLIERAVGKRAKIQWCGPQPGDTGATHADISKAHRLLGYSPRIDIEDGIRAFVNWFMK